MTTDCYDNDSSVEDLAVQSEEKAHRINSLSLYPMTTDFYDNDSVVEDLIYRIKRRETE